MKKLYVGLTQHIGLPQDGLLLIDDEIPDVREWRRPRTLDPLKRSFNPLKTALRI